MTLIELMSASLKLDETYISSIVSGANFYYRDYCIPKRNGSQRLISQPGPELKTLQYWVVDNILRKLPISKSASAYNKGNSIKANALLHANSKHILHLDIKNFFPSIRPHMLDAILDSNEKIFKSLNIDLSSSKKTINNICFRNEVLCIGTVSSPIISNIVMYNFDELMLSFCKASNYQYSRYADDMYISSNTYINESVLDYIGAELSKLGFVLNKAKTRFYSQKYRRKITGLVITDNGMVSVGKIKRTEIKKMVYNKLVHHKGNPSQILGYLAFLKDVEPNTYNSIIVKYSKYCDSDIIKAIMEE